MDNKEERKKIYVDREVKRRQDRICECNDLVYHVCDYFRIRDKLRELTPVKEEVDLPIPERVDKIYAYPSLEDALEGWIKGSGIIAICVDNKKAIVSDDFDAFHKNESEWRRKVVTLKRWRQMGIEEKKEYRMPEVILNIEDVAEANIVAVFMYASGILVPCKIKAWE